MCSISGSISAPRREGTAIDQDPAIWWAAASQALHDLLGQVDRAVVRAIAVDGTSGTLLLTDAGGTPLGPGLMYNDARAGRSAARITSIAPATSGVRGASSALAKLLHLVDAGAAVNASYALHQAD